MKSEETLTLIELLEQLNSMKDAFFTHGSNENLCNSLKYVLKHGLDDYLSNEEVSLVFASIFVGHETDKAMSSRHAIISAVRDTGTELERREIKKKILRALVAHSSIYTDQSLQGVLRHMFDVRGQTIDVFINNQKQKRIPA